MEKPNKITGFGFANPNVLLAVIKYSKYIPIPLFEATQKSYKSVQDSWKTYKNDKRRKVLLVRGLDTLERLKADAPIDLSQAIVTVFDSLNKLAAHKFVMLADATPGTAKDPTVPTYTVRPFDLDTVLEASMVGLPEDVEPPPAPEPPQEAAVETQPVPEKAPKQRPDSLSALFDGYLASIEDEQKRQKAASWVAARIEGLLDKESWDKALGKMQGWGVEPELIRAAMRLLRETGRLAALRTAYQSVMDGAKPKAAAVEAGVAVSDLRWLLERWTG